MIHPEPPAGRPEKRPLAPDVGTLDPRSARAWTEPMAVTPLGSGRYAVESASGNRYVVDIPTHACTCPDATIRGETCKHRRRVAIEITRGLLPPPGKRAGRCAACGHDRFVPEAGPALCDACRFAPGDVARDRETGDLVVAVRSTDVPADEWAIPSTGESVASYGTNAGYPTDDPVVEVVYPFSGDSDRPLLAQRRYAFPHSRLERQDQQLLD